MKLVLEDRSFLNLTVQNLIDLKREPFLTKRVVKVCLFSKINNKSIFISKIAKKTAAPMIFFILDATASIKHQR